MKKVNVDEKVAYLEDYINNHHGEDYAEWLWEQTNKCRTNEELARLVDIYL